MTAPAPTKVCPRCGTRYERDATFCARDGAALTPLAGDPLVGQVLLGQFRIDQLIGSGGMGAVYRARQVSVGRDVAIKVVHPELAMSPDAVRRFEREARISGALDHPNVVRAFLSGQLPDGSLYLVMELLEGRSLADLLRVEPTLPLSRALHILVQTAEGVGAAHEQDVVHRDVKPENVYLVTRGRDPDAVKVLDFGIARRFGPDEAIALTAAGVVLGTALYISPEAAAGVATDARSDVYSLGVLAYRMLAGVVPFDATSPAGLLIKHLQQPPPPLVAPRGTPPIPAPIALVVMRALAKSPAERYADANDFAQALRDAAFAADVEWGRPKTGRFSLATRPASPSAPTPAPERTSLPLDDVGPLDAPPPSRLVLGVAFLVGVLLVVGIYVVWPHGSSDPAPTQVRAEAVKRAEEALAERRWEGPEGVGATTGALLAERSDDPDALRIRRAAATLLVEEGDHERAAGHPDEARARYDAALALLVEGTGAESRLAGLGGGAAPAAETITISPAPIAGQPVMITATTLDDGLPLLDPRFVVIEGGRRLGGPIPAVATGAGRTFSITYTFPRAGTCTVEFRIRHDADAYAFRSTVEVAPAPQPPARPSVPEIGPGPVTTQG